MNFLAMSAAQAVTLALVTAGLITALYFLKLRRRRLITPSLLLWKTILEQRQARSIFEKLRNPLSLLLAIAIGLLLALALARPDIEALTGKRRRVTLVVDSSPTMLTRAGQETRWRKAIKEAGALLDAGGPTTEFRIADTSGQTDTAYMTDRTELHRILEGMQPKTADLRFPAPDAATSDDVVTETWFVSDGVAKLDVPPDVRRVSVFEEARNVGIVAFEIRQEPSSPLHFTAYLEVQNYGKAETSAEIAIAGAKGSEIKRQAKLVSGGRFQEAFDLSGFPGGDVTATVRSEGDAFDLDDRAFSYIPVAQRTRTLLVTSGSRYLETALKLDPRVDLQVVAPAAFQETDDVDAYVFDRFAPSARPKRPALVIGAPAASWLPKAVGAVSDASIALRLDSHPVIRNVALHDVSIRQAAKVGTEGLVALASSKDTPLIAASEPEVSPKWVLLTFALEATDFPYQAGFPVFLENALGWFSREPLALVRTPGLVRLPFRDATVERDGRPVEARAILNETVFEADRPGLYVATHDGQRQRVAVNLVSREFSDVNRTVATDAAPSAPTRPLLSREVWFYMVLVALVLIVVEWFTYHRRITL